MSDLDRFAEKPFQEVLEYWAETMVEQEATMPDCFSEIVLGYSFTLPNGVQAKIEIGRDIIEDEK